MGTLTILRYRPPPMDRLATKIVIGMLGVLALGQLCAGCGDVSPSPSNSGQESVLRASESYQREAAVPVAVAVVREPESPEAPEWRPDPLDVVDRCDTITIKATDHGPIYGKILPEWIRSERDRAREQYRLRLLIRMIGDEMGIGETESELLWRIAIRESSGNTGSVHVLGADMEANERSSHYGRRMATRWRSAPTAAYNVHRGELARAGFIDGWKIGRGPFGMNSSLFLPRWSTDAPPWALCDPVVATITAVWSMRAGLESCKATTLRAAHRRFAAGKCSPREAKRERQFGRLARGHVRGLELERFDPDKRADFGDRWMQDDTDPAELYALLHDRAVALGLADR